MESNQLIQSLSESQQMDVYNLMTLANIDDIDFAAQMLVEADFDVNKAAQKWMDLQSGVQNNEPVENETGNIDPRNLNNDFEGTDPYTFDDYQTQPRSADNPKYIDTEDLRLEMDAIMKQLQDQEAERSNREKGMAKLHEDFLNVQKEYVEGKAKAQLIQEQKRQEEEKQQLRKSKLAKLPSEPAESDSSAITIALRLPNGIRLERRFRPFDKVEFKQVLYDYVDSNEVEFHKSTVRYDLIQPRPFLSLDDKSKTLNDYFEGSKQEAVQIREHTS